MTKPLAVQLIQEISCHIDMETEYSNPTQIQLHLQVLATLQFLGCGSFQRRVGRDGFCTMSQSCISVAIQKICFIIANKLAPDYVNFPSTAEEATKIKNKFYDKYGVPGITGISDGTHIAISHLPKNEEYAYVNRKNFKSINMQGV